VIPYARTVQGNDEVIELLNEVLTAELTAINQYFVDAKMLGNWGYERLASKFRDESIDEMKDADRLIERVLYLEGMPNLQRLGSVRVGEDTAEKLRLALDLEREAIERLNRGIALCVGKGDNGSRELLEEILEGEEEHADWLETQLELIRQVGDAHYLAQQMHG
jgi:bacterioferritin